MARFLALLSLMLIQACEGQVQPGGFPAVIEEPTPASRAELVQVISKALNSISVTIAEDALTESSRLVIERKKQRNLRGRIGSGRVMEPPEQFRLMIVGSGCVLVRLADEARYLLKDTRCRRLRVDQD